MIDNTYNKAETQKDNPFKGIKDVGQAESILNQFRRDNQGNEDGAENLLHDLLEALFENEDSLFGDANDFHNFAVSISKLTQDNQNATRIIKAGLKIHPMNTDLLADAIKYGYNCGEKAVCKQCYCTLQSIDKSRWTWRAFSFSKDYLMDEWTSNIQNDYSIDDIFKLVHEYQTHKPDAEDAWLCEFEVYEATNRKEEGIKVLETAINKFRFCPRCWLRYADLMMDRGEYEKAEPVIRKMCRNPKSGDTINASYMYFLDGQCRLTRLFESNEYEEYDDDEDAAVKVEKEVWKVYKSFRKSLTSSGLRENVKAQIDEYITQIENDTNIHFPDEWRT